MTSRRTLFKLNHLDNQYSFYSDGTFEWVSRYNPRARPALGTLTYWKYCDGTIHWKEGANDRWFVIGEVQFGDAYRSYLAELILDPVEAERVRT